MIPKKKRYVMVLCIVVCVALVAGIAAFGINAYIKHSCKEKILTAEQAAALEDVDCILVLGCLVKDDGTPSDMLSDRLQKGVELYTLGVSQKILMSGDHSREDYDEVGVMKQYAIEANIASSDIFKDHLGLSTYDSMYRAKEIFGADKIVIVTQEYHLYRALYIAKKLGIEAYGVSSDDHIYAGQLLRDIREVMARNKDFFVCIFKPKLENCERPVSLSGDGNITNFEN